MPEPRATLDDLARSLEAERLNGMPRWNTRRRPVTVDDELTTARRRRELLAEIEHDDERRAAR